MDNREEKWLRKMSGLEIAMDKINQKEICLVVYRLSLCSTAPVQPNKVEEALGYLYRKAPNLRVCIRDRGGEPWFVEMDKESVDFEVSTESVEEVTQVLHTRVYSHDAPLWCGRLLPVSSPSYHPQHLASFHHDLQDSFPHCYHLLLGFSHAIGDGHSFIRICAALVHILDRVLSGEEVDGEQIGSFALNEEFDRKEEACIARIFTDDAWREECIREANQGVPALPIIRHLLSGVEGQPKKTLLYTQTLEEDATTRLLGKCRAAGVTLSSCLAALGNLALVELLEERDVVQDSYVISNSHLINMRRTWPKGTTEHAFGCYISTSMRQFLATPRSAEGEKFWEYAKYVHGRFYSLLEDQQYLEKAAFSLWCYITNAEQYLQRDLTYNTRGDLTRRFQGTRNIKVTNLLSSTSIHNSDIPWDHVFGTVRGRLSHTIKYNTSVVSEDTATRYGDLVFGRLVKTAAP